MFYLDIDISKDKFDIALIGDDIQIPKRKVLSNNQEGFNKLLSWLLKRADGEVHACMEATGSYYEALATFLVQAGITTSVVNPTLTSNFAKCSATRNKTDSIDALGIAEFCKAKRPRPWTPLTPEAKELKELVRRLSALQESKVDEENRLTSGVSSFAVEQSISKSIQFLSDQIDELESLIKDHIDANPDIKKNKDLLVTIPGIGEKTAAFILAELPDVSNFDNAKQVAAYAGLSPREYRSGSSVRGKTRLCKVGSSRLRKALYFPAIVAKTHNPVVKDLYRRLLSAGKTKMCAIGAAMRKLLHIAFGVLRRQEAFNPLAEIGY